MSKLNLKCKIVARVSPATRRTVFKEVRERRKKGEGIQASDIFREALSEYFQKREAKVA